MKGIDCIYTGERNTYRAFYLSTHPSEKGRRGFESRSGQKPIFRMDVSKGKMHGMCSFLLYIYSLYLSSFASKFLTFMCSSVGKMEKLRNRARLSRKPINLIQD